MIHNSHTRKKRDLESSGGTSFPEVEHLESCLSSLRFFNRWLNVTSKSWRWTSMMSAETCSSSLESFSISLPTSFSIFSNLSIVSLKLTLLQIFSANNLTVVFEFCKARQQETEVHKFLRSNLAYGGKFEFKTTFQSLLPKKQRFTLNFYRKISTFHKILSKIRNRTKFSSKQSKTVENLSNIRICSQILVKPTHFTNSVEIRNKTDEIFVKQIENSF